MGTSKMETALRQEQITQAALNIVSSSGLNALSIAAIADRIGLVPSAIYRHFKGKEEVLDAVLDLVRDMLMKNVAAIYEETNDPVERLKRLLMRHIKMIKGNKGIPRIIFAEDLYKTKPERKQKVYDNLKRYLTKVSEIIRQGQEEEQIRKDVEPMTLSVMFLGLIQPSAIMWHLSDGEFDAEKQAKKAWRIFEGEIRARKEDAPVINKG